MQGGWRQHGDAPSDVVVLHGGPGGAGEVAPLASGLARRGYRVLEPFQTRHSVREQVEELAAQITAAGRPPVAIVGWSWGAWLGCLLAARHERLVRTLVLVGSGPFESHHAERIEDTKAARLTAAESAELRRLDPRRGDAAEVARFIEISDRADTYARDASPQPEVTFDAAIHTAVWSEADAMRRSGALLEEVGTIRCPVVVLHGDHDPRPAEGVHEPLGSVLPTARFVLLDRCGHKPWQERYARAAFYAALNDAIG